LGSFAKLISLGKEMDAPITPETDVDVVDVASRLRLAIARLHRILRQQAGTGLSPSQQSVLASIDVNTTLTLGELAAFEQVAPPTITKIVAKLAEDGLVERTVDARDRRVARVAVTPEGHRRMDHSRQRRNAWLAQRLAELPAGDARRLVAALDVIEKLAGPMPSPPAVPSAPSGPSASPGPSAPPDEAGETADPVPS
jgi:DNA-binding MarR family transcriptional regulator